LPTTTMLSARKIAHWKSKINDSSTTESGLCRNAGPSALHLQEYVKKRQNMT